MPGTTVALRLEKYCTDWKYVSPRTETSPTFRGTGTSTRAVIGGNAGTGGAEEKDLRRIVNPEEQRQKRPGLAER